MNTITCVKRIAKQGAIYRIAVTPECKELGIAPGDYVSITIEPLKFTPRE